MIPTRHQRRPEQPSTARLRYFIPGNPEPTNDEWQAIGLALLRGDPPADELASWIAEDHSRFRIFEAALTSERSANEPAPLRRFFDLVESRPSWVDDHLLAEGARVSHLSGASGLYALRDLALMGGYQASAINKTLLFTGALERGAPRRLAETLKWHTDITTVGGLAKDRDGFRGTIRVRVVHALIRRQLGQKLEWRSEEWGLPVNQADMAATYLGFCVLHLIGARALGVLIRDAESRAFMHLWRYIGWLMGVEDRWLVEDEAAGRLELLHFLIGQAPPDESSQQLGRALMDEPLHRHHRALEGVQRRYEWTRHLSINAFFLGRSGMRALGLPRTLPWFPVASLATVAPTHAVLRMMPGGRSVLIRVGRAAQLRTLRTVLEPGELRR